MVLRLVGFEALSRCLIELGVPHSAAEVHGLITGLLAAGARISSKEGRAAVSEWLGLEVVVTATHAELLEEVFEQVAAGLQDPELNFKLLLPDEEASIALRTQSLGEWCGGFLAGFGLAGRYQNSDLSDDLRELLADLSHIANLDEDVPDDEENESDLVEIFEYVRLSALMVFAECSSTSFH